MVTGGNLRDGYNPPPPLPKVERAIRIAATVIVGLLLAVVFITAGDLWTWFTGYTNRWHDTWEIVGALGSAGAAGAAVWIASRERADRQAAERDRDQARREQRAAELAGVRREREAQARQVVVWLTRQARTPIGDGPPRPPWVLAWYANYSSMPIKNAVVVARGELIKDNGFVFALLPGHEPVQASFSEEILATKILDSDIAVDFRDAANVRWRRGADGSLDEVPDL